MFVGLSKLHAIVEETSKMDLEDKTVEYDIDADDQQVGQWLEDLNNEVSKILEDEPDMELGAEGDKMNLVEAMEAMVYYVTLILHQVAPHGMIRDACIHHNMRCSATRQNNEKDAASTLAKAIIETINKLAEPQEDPFADIPELPEGTQTISVIPNKD
jgi:hypothetical protein